MERHLHHNGVGNLLAAVAEEPGVGGNIVLARQPCADGTRPDSPSRPPRGASAGDRRLGRRGMPPAQRKRLGVRAGTRENKGPPGIHPRGRKPSAGIGPGPFGSGKEGGAGLPGPPLGFPGGCRGKRGVQAPFGPLPFPFPRGAQLFSRARKFWGLLHFKGAPARFLARGTQFRPPGFGRFPGGKRAPYLCGPFVGPKGPGVVVKNLAWGFPRGVFPSPPLGAPGPRAPGKGGGPAGKGRKGLPFFGLRPRKPPQVFPGGAAGNWGDFFGAFGPLGAPGSAGPQRKGWGRPKVWANFPGSPCGGPKRYFAPGGTGSPKGPLGSFPGAPDPGGGKPPRGGKGGGGGPPRGEKKPPRNTQRGGELALWAPPFWGKELCGPPRGGKSRQKKPGENSNGGGERKSPAARLFLPPAAPRVPKKKGPSPGGRKNWVVPQKGRSLWL